MNVRKPRSDKGKKKKAFLHPTGVLIIGLAFCAMMALLIMVQGNLRYSVRKENLTLLPKEELIRLKSELGAPQNKECLLVMEEDDPMTAIAAPYMEDILTQMKVGYDVCHADRLNRARMDRYSKLILAVTNYPKLTEALAELPSWVSAGGNLLILFPPENSGSFQSLGTLLGIKESADFELVEGIHFCSDFMLGGTAHDFTIIDGYESALALTLKDDCEVFMESTGKYPVPLLWRRTVGDGTVVFNNLGIMEKSYRGFHWAAYSLLSDSCIYPVINGATFYIDDFPSPVPNGDGQYLSRDYNMSVSDFYVRVWWNDVYGLARKYEIPYTGLLLEEYSNQVSGEFERNTEVNSFQYYGNMLLRSGGEIGLHGYNHMPLVLVNFDYQDLFDEYTQWKSEADIRRALKETYSFIDMLFPEVDPIVYVPPSNILSKEGKEILNDMGVRAIASVYLPGEVEFDQEFEICAEDGIVHTPRVISGYVLGDYIKMAALSELNFHFVSTHFQHPDDVLDEDRGAALGWETLFSNFKGYVEWLYSSAPDIRNLTGTELAAAVQRYDLIRYESHEENGALKLSLSNFQDEAWMMLRVNDGRSIKKVTGARYKKVADGLFLLECQSEEVTVQFQEGGRK